MSTPAQLILGTATFKWNTTLPGTDPEKAYAYAKTLSNVGIRMPNEIQKLEHFALENGERKRDKTFITEKKLGLVLTVEEFSSDLWDLFFGTDRDNPTPLQIQSVYIHLAVEAEGETAKNQSSGSTEASDGILILHSWRADMHVQGEPSFDRQNLSQLEVVVDIDLTSAGKVITGSRPIST